MSVDLILLHFQYSHTIVQEEQQNVYKQTHGNQTEKHFKLAVKWGKHMLETGTPRGALDCFRYSR